jgi:hypothetical protein
MHFTRKEQSAHRLFRRPVEAHLPSHPVSFRKEVQGLPLFLTGMKHGFASNFGSLTDSAAAPLTTTPLELNEEQELAPVTGHGVEAYLSAFQLQLQGRTDADFTSSFSTENGRTRRGAGCEGCLPEDCVQATGVLVSTFQVNTTVTLPSVDDFPGLTPCQRQRVQNAITSVLTPHEQQHVRAFRTYNGTVRTPFNLTVCRPEFDARIQAMHDGIEARRRTDAQARSDALDPFQFTVDLNCEEPSAPRRQAVGP